MGRLKISLAAAHRAIIVIQLVANVQTATMVGPIRPWRIAMRLVVVIFFFAAKKLIDKRKSNNPSQQAHCQTPFATCLCASLLVLTSPMRFSYADCTKSYLNFHY